MDDYMDALNDASVGISGEGLLDDAQEDASPSSSTGKRPKGRDAAKASNKKASVSSEYVSKMHDLSVQKIELFKETEVERKARLDEMVALEKVKVEEAREHRKMMLELERERLAMEQKRLQMEAKKKEKEEDERILAINLDQCQPMQRIYYQALQEDILQKIMSRRNGPSQ
ncbi:arginine and glutamate-rich protein 1-like [Panicum miliaceum]|uniref:Arginine and glutamate-rich protein 1-like n=1 Tax=Panicum miliaceum TaxID=4540 RepID=A0A3L6TPW5_PANMI|nr:arginine and glutamate-rich protein 1-like [Panicum miliaceum]